MFSEVEFEWKVLVQPDAMKSSAHIHRAVILKLLKDFNDVKCTQQHGYHVVLTTLESIGVGKLWEWRGCVAFPVRFRCVVFNVFTNEHVLAVVTEINSDGIYSQCGPIESVYIAKRLMRDYDLLSTEVDSLEVTKWRNFITGTTIKKGDVIRVEILKTEWDPAHRSLSAAGALTGVYTGIDDRWPDLNKTNPKQRAAVDGGWGEPATNGDGDGGGWGEPTQTDITGNGVPCNGGWGESSQKEAIGNGVPCNDGWVEQHTNEDGLNGTSGWN
ncbi:unnamed protein product [Calypogeia fissa]